MWYTEYINIYIGIITLIQFYICSTKEFVTGYQIELCHCSVSLIALTALLTKLCINFTCQFARMLIVDTIIIGLDIT